MNVPMRNGLFVGTAVLVLTGILWVFAGDSPAADSANGKKVFEANCVACHGTKGDGNGPAGPALNPKPRNFTSAAEMKGIDDARLKKSVSEGRPGTAMVAWAGMLSGKDIEDVIAYVKAFPKK